MCGRIALFSNKEELQAAAQVLDWDQNWNPKYNIAPTNSIPILFLKNSQKCMKLMHWGFKSVKELNTINCRSESLKTSTFWSRFSSNRCVLFINGFYEWKSYLKGSSKNKIPYYIHSKSETFLVLAGIYEIYKSDYSFSILTTSAPVDFIHSRIPIILSSSREIDEWLELGKIPNECKEENLELTTVSSFVNKVGNESSKCIEYHEEGSKQGPMDAFVIRKKK